MESSADSNTKPSIADYVSIARPDHWVKHIFIVPGLALALILNTSVSESLYSNVLLGFISACLIASANYVINEWLDAEFDRHHPHKYLRAAASGKLSAPIVYFEYILCSAVGLLLASYISNVFFATSVVFLISGILYNVRPFRTKERAYLDVISESFNNPIRIMLGWSMVSESTIPPISLIFIFWFGGAFLMAIKRYSEYRLIVESKGSESLASYRRSFAKYSDVSLLVSSFFYAMLCAFALGVFLIKYRTEYVFAFPFFTALFSYYLYLGVKDAPSVQAPEKLYQEKGLMVILSLLIATLALLTLVDFPLLNKFILSSFTMLNFR